MSKMADLDYDIQELFIEGLTAQEIATQLECPLEIVQGTLASFGVEAEDLDPFYGA